MSKILFGMGTESIIVSVMTYLEIINPVPLQQLVAGSFLIIASIVMMFIERR